MLCTGLAQLDELGEPETAATFGEITQHRQTEEGELEYCIEDATSQGNVEKSWHLGSDISSVLLRGYELNRLKLAIPKNKKKRKMRARMGANCATLIADHVLAEDAVDVGDCEIDKSIQGNKEATAKVQRRRLGGIIAAVTGCRIVMDYAEHQFGEGTPHVYTVLARLTSILLSNQAVLPKVIFFDNACALWKYATNPKRCERTEVTRLIKGFHYMLDFFHALNHRTCLRDSFKARWLDPRHPENKDLTDNVDTSACEQAFSFIDRITYVGMNMGWPFCHISLPHT